MKEELEFPSSESHLSEEKIESTETISRKGRSNRALPLVTVLTEQVGRKQADAEQQRESSEHMSERFRYPIPVIPLEYRHNAPETSSGDDTATFHSETAGNESITPSVSSAAEIVKTPDIVLEHVKSAAEHDIPVEKFYERRHEIKDDQAGGGLQNPTLQSELHEQNVTQLSTDQSTQAQPTAQTSSSKALPTSYRQAARTGFWIAFGFLLLFGCLLLIL